MSEAIDRLNATLTVGRRLIEVEKQLQDIYDEWAGSWQREIRELSPELAALLDGSVNDDA